MPNRLLEGPVASGFGRADEPALQAHHRRVRLAATELAERLRWDEERLHQVQQQVTSHHVCFPRVRMLRGAVGELREDGSGSVAAAPPPDGEIAALLELACLFVERWEYCTYEPVTFEQMVEELHWVAQEGLVRETHVQALSSVLCANRDHLRQAADRLLVFPTVALEAIALASNPMAHLGKAEQIVHRDPVLAGELLAVANSARYASLHPVRSVKEALLRLGLGESCKVMVAAAMRPVLVREPSETLWRHSLEIGALAEAIARRAKVGRPEEAYLAGLVHDIGRLAFLGLPHATAVRRQKLLQQDVETNFSEFILCGTDHAAAGAEVARRWRLPGDIVEAIGMHHQPEQSQSPLASVLYLAEHWSGAHEDLPSLTRLHFALNRLSLDPNESRSPSR